MVRHGTEPHGDLLPIAAERLAGAQAEPGSRPAPAVELELDLGEGLRAVPGRDAVFVVVAAVPGATGPRADVAGLERAHRAKDVDLAVAQIPFTEADRRLHRDEAEELQEVVLHHVLERADVVVVA